MLEGRMMTEQSIMIGDILEGAVVKIGPSIKVGRTTIAPC
jgi:hypothetical protein